MFFHGQFKRDFTSCNRFDFEKVSERQIMLCEFLITFYGLYPEIENVGLTQNYEFFYHQCPSISIYVIIKNKIDHLSAFSNPSGSQSFIITFMNSRL